MTSGAFTPKTRWIIIRRDSDEHGTPTCTWCGRAVRIEPGEYSIQHVRARGMGGSRLADTGQPQNGTLVHGTGTTGCHGYITAHPTEAQARGFQIFQTQNPATTPMTLWDGRRVIRTPQGTLEPAD